LSISRPEFYRQLRAGRRAVADAIAALAQRTLLEPDIPRDPLEVRLHGAFVLALTGRLDAAVRYLTPVLETVSGFRLVRAACVLGEFRFDESLARSARLTSNSRAGLRGR